MIYVLDASVYVARHSAHEKHHERAKELWNLLAPTSRFHVPAIFPLEIISAFARVQNDNDVIAEHKSLASGAKFILYPIENLLLENAMVVARDGRVRSADAIYMALALHLDATFLTLDIKLMKHLSTSPNSTLREIKIQS